MAVTRSNIMAEKYIPFPEAETVRFFEVHHRVVNEGNHDLVDTGLIDWNREWREQRVKAETWRVRKVCLSNWKRGGGRGGGGKEIGIISERWKIWNEERDERRGWEWKMKLKFVSIIHFRFHSFSSFFGKITHCGIQ